MVLFAAVGVGCAHTDSVAPSDLLPATLNAELQGRVLIVHGIDSPLWAADPLTIRDGRIDGDTLRLTVSYGGGCRPHSLQPLAEAAWLESFPVQVMARIAHNAGGDLCRALITRSLRIDLSPLRDRYRASYRTPSGTITLRIDGLAEPVAYAF
jgi:hypothetical protein